MGLINPDKSKKINSAKNCYSHFLDSMYQIHNVVNNARRQYQTQQANKDALAQTEHLMQAFQELEMNVATLHIQPEDAQQYLDAFRDQNFVEKNNLSFLVGNKENGEAHIGRLQLDADNKYYQTQPDNLPSLTEQQIVDEIKSGYKQATLIFSSKDDIANIIQRLQVRVQGNNLKPKDFYTIEHKQKYE